MHAPRARRPHGAALAAMVGIALLLATGATSTAVTPGVDAEALLQHVQFLASDQMRGRANGSAELERAAEYIAEQFKTAGLEPGGDAGSWFQRFEVDAGLEVGVGNTLTLKSGTRSVTLNLGTSYYPLASMADDTPDTPSADLKDVPVVFAGYGVSAPGLRYDDYAGIDVRGKAVLVFTHEPQETQRRSRFNGNQAIPETSLSAKALAARNRGAVALLIVSDPAHPRDTAPFRAFQVDPDADLLGLPVLRLRRDEMGPLLLAWSLDRLARFIDDDLQPRSRELPGATLNYREALSRRHQTVKNVVGILPSPGGSFGNEAVVIGAHYDHVGVGGRFSAVPERTGEIHNGADDNASGTAALIEMARVAGGNRGRFARRLIFAAFAGEERGLLGSRHFTRQPSAQVADTVAMLNLDMVGRLRGTVAISGLGTSPSLLPDVAAAAHAAGLLFRRSGPGADRSDDAPFLGAGVPAISFFTGFHGDYHRPSDDWRRINAAGTAQVAEMALELVARISARPDRPEVTRPR